MLHEAEIGRASLHVGPAHQDIHLVSVEVSFHYTFTAISVVVKIETIDSLDSRPSLADMLARLPFDEGDWWYAVVKELHTITNSGHLRGIDLGL